MPQHGRVMRGVSLTVLIIVLDMAMPAAGFWPSAHEQHAPSAPVREVCVGFPARSYLPGE